MFWSKKIHEKIKFVYNDLKNLFFFCKVSNSGNQSINSVFWLCIFIWLPVFIGIEYWTTIWPKNGIA